MKFIDNMIDMWKWAGTMHLECNIPMSLEDSKTVFRLACPDLNQPIWRSNERMQNMKRTILKDTIGDAFDLVQPLLKRKGYILEALSCAQVVSSEEPLVTESRYTYKLLDLSSISDLSDDDISLVRI